MILTPLSMRSSRALAHAHILWLKHAFDANSPIAPETIRAYLRPSQIVGEDGDIVITEAGFVTMAILTNCATQHDGLTAVPGCDETGRRGYLVFGAGKLPYHSLADTAQAACAEALGKQQLAQALIQHFGSKAALYAAVKQAPLFQRCTAEDLERSGLCLWGAESFLGRMGLLRFTRRFGLPTFMLLLAGNYGRRIIAASVAKVSESSNNPLPVHETQEG